MIRFLERFLLVPYGVLFPLKSSRLPLFPTWKCSIGSIALREGASGIFKCALSHLHRIATVKIMPRRIFLPSIDVIGGNFRVIFVATNGILEPSFDSEGIKRRVKIWAKVMPRRRESVASFFRPWAIFNYYGVSLTRSRDNFRERRGIYCL